MEGASGGKFEGNQKIKPEIKYYLYPLESFPSFWGPESKCDHSKIYNPKHDGYIHAMQAMKRHPWRTPYPSEAKLAILPISIDVFARGGCPGLKPAAILEEVQSVIRNSTLFPKIRHVFIATDWKQMDGIPGKIFEVLKPAGIKVAMEGRGDCQTSFPYNTNYAEFMSLRSPNGWRMPNPAPFGKNRIYSVNMVGTFVEKKGGFKERVALFTSNGSLPKSFIVSNLKLNGKQQIDMMKKGFRLRFCKQRNDTDRCLSQDDFPSREETQSVMEQSNYTLALRGDTPGSDRWSQAMVAGTALIHVISGDWQWNWLPFPCEIPWRDMVLSIPRDKYMKDPIRSIKSLIGSVTEERLLELQHLSMHYAADIDWAAHDSKVLENFLRESYYVPCRAFELSMGVSDSVKLHEQAWCIPHR